MDLEDNIIAPTKLKFSSRKISGESTFGCLHECVRDSALGFPSLPVAMWEMMQILVCSSIVLQFGSELKKMLGRHGGYFSKKENC